MKQKVLSILALLLMAVTGAWAQDAIQAIKPEVSLYKVEGFSRVYLVKFNDGEKLHYIAPGSEEIEKVYSETSVDGNYGNVLITVSQSGDLRLWTTTDESTSDNVIVEVSCDTYTDVSGVTLSQTTAEMTVGGDALTLTATVAPDNATDKTVTWTTSDANVATVTDGVVTAVAAGTATITATATNGTADTSDDFSATCEVTVADAATKYDLTLATGTEDAANWTISPTSAAENETVTIKYNGTKKVKSIKAVKKVPTDLSTITASYTAQDGETLTGTLANNVKISIADGATVTLKDVNINGSGSWSSGDYAGLTPEGDATIVLEGTNTVTGFALTYPGIFVPEDKTLTIKGTGSLTASSNKDEYDSGAAAGIGGGEDLNCGNIVIESGTVVANGYGGSGIGGTNGNGIKCGNITISGGTVTATSTAAGIGSGSVFASCGNIEITGGNVTATGYTVGIGTGGFYGSCGAITISGGTVKATCLSSGAGIGMGIQGKCGDITISGGTVEATGGNSSAGIGGSQRTKFTAITISGGTVTATGGENGAGIGNGETYNNEKSGAITISGGTVTATGGENAAGIGGGYDNNDMGAITITSDVTRVTATKGEGATHSIGKGGGSGNGPTVTIGGVSGAITESPYTYDPSAPSLSLTSPAVGQTPCETTRSLS